MRCMFSTHEDLEDSQLFLELYGLLRMQVPRRWVSLSSMKTRSRSVASVSIHVRDLSKMFNSLDPSPFWAATSTTALRRSLLRAVTALPHVLSEGLIILGWISLWRPTEMLAYEWVPLVRKRRLYERLAALQVAVRSDVVSVPTPAAQRGGR
jgi:hypothetical protein